MPRVLSDVKTTYSPQAVVCQCGADGLAGDPMQSFNLTAKALVDSVSYIHKWGLPLLLVGGGKVLINPYNTEIFLYKPWKPKSDKRCFLFNLKLSCLS